MINLIFIILIAGAALAFSIQNVNDVTASFLVWRFNVSVSTISGVALLAGIIVAQSLQRLMTKRQEKAKNTIEFVTRRH